MTILVVRQLVIMLIIICAGFIFSKILKISSSDEKFLSKLLLYFINPCIIINSFNVEFDGGKLKQLVFVLLISVVVHVVMILISFIFTRTKNEKLVSYCQIEKVGIVFTNCGFMGIPLIRGVFGNEGIFFLMGYLIIFNIFLWTYGYYQMSGSINLKKIITNPNIIAVVIGLVLFCTPLSVPKFLVTPISMISECNTVIAMILLGILFADFHLPSKSENAVMTSAQYIFRIIKFSFVRIVVCSVVNILLIFAVYKLFGNIEQIKMICFVVLICSMCPAATSVPSLSCLFNKDSAYASVVVSLTSILCIISIPSFVALAELIIK